MSRRTTVLVVLLTLLLCAAALNAQDVNGTIAGVVRDASGSVIPNALVVGSNTGTSARFEARSTSDGAYALRSIPIGVYDITVEANGFKRYEASGVRLQVNETARVDINMQVGGTTETVTVSAEVTAVDTTTATLKTVVDQKRIEELPLNGRNPTQLMRLVAGVVTDLRADVTSGTTYPGVTAVSVNGSRSNQTNYVLDGAQNNDHYTNAPNPMPNPDALQEFSVQTNNFSAEFGRQAGGLVNAVTKSGTNSLHGSAFEFVRNNALNATNFFAPVINGSRQSDGLKRNQFGATLGGPVILPKIYNGHSKTFFFFSYQGTTERRVPTSGTVVVPTAAQRAGDFSGLKAIKDPATGLPYPNNVIPASQLNPIATALLKYIPTPAAGNTISLNVPNNANDDQFLVRLDHELSQNNRLSGRFWNSYAETPAFLNPLNYLEQNTGRTWLNRSTQITDTHVFGATVTNQAMFAFNRTDGNNVPVYPAASFSDLGSKIYNDKQTQLYVAANGYWGTLNTGDTNRFLRDEYQILDTVRWTTGRHQATFGFDYGHGIGDTVNNFKGNGRFTFNGAAAPFTGDSFADYLIGRFYSLEQGVGEYKKTRFNRIALFAQDSFKMTSRFTLDLGIRWEPFLPFTDVDGKLAAWHPGQQSTRYVNAPLGIVYPGDQGVPQGGAPTRWNNFAPRAGFAWDVFGNGKTSVRGAYGIFFDQMNTLATNNLANQAPFGTTVTIFGNLTNSLTDPWAGTTNPFPGNTNPPSNVSFPQFSTQTVYSPDFRNAYVQSWNMTIEREVFSSFVTRVSYAGSKGTRLPVMRELNAAVYVPGATTSTTNQRRPYAPGLGTVSIDEPVGNSIYHALQLTAEKRFSRGFSVLANYQFSKAIDDASTSKISGQARTNPYNQAFDRGPADFDRAHVFNASALWDMPIHFQNRVVNTLVGGWSLNSIVSLWSGFPFSVYSGVDNARTGTGNQRADLVGNPYLADDRPKADKINQWLNKGAFTANALGTYGNSGRNIFRGPGFASIDGGLFKRFALTERLAATLRFEAFNVLNHTNLVGPNSTSLTSGNFLKTTQAYDPRILQIALRLTW